MLSKIHISLRTNMQNIGSYKKFEDLLQELKRSFKQSVTEKIEEVEEISERYLIFFLEKESFAVPIRQLQEVLLDKQVVPVPGAPLSVHGVINYRNKILAVTNMHYVLQIPYKSVTSTCILITRNINLQTALLVDGIIDLVTVTQTDIKSKISRPMKPVDRIIAGEMYFRKKLVTLLDLEGLD